MADKLPTLASLTQSQIAARLLAGDLAAQHIPAAIQALVAGLKAKRDSVRRGCALDLIRIATTQEIVKADEDDEGEKQSGGTVIVLNNSDGKYSAELERRLSTTREVG